MDLELFLWIMLVTVVLHGLRHKAREKRAAKTADRWEETMRELEREPDATRRIELQVKRLRYERDIAAYLKQ